MNVQHFHSMYILEGVAPGSGYHRLYEQISKYLSEGYAVVYVVESNPSQVATKIADVDPKSKSFLQSKALTLVDKNTFYLPKKMNSYGRPMLDEWYSLLSKIKESGSYRGFLVMGMLPDAFFEGRSQKKIVDYEKTIAKNFDNLSGIEAICCYTMECIERLPLSYVLGLLNSHQRIIYPDFERFVWTPEKSIKVVENALNRFFPDETSKLILRTVRNYAEDKSIISQPEAFEEDIRRMFGRSAEIIFDSIKAEIKEVLSRP